MYESEISACIEEALRRENEKKRRSSIWFENYRRRHGLASTQLLDGEIFFRMFQKEPKAHEIQRVRFWRLSRHLPMSRKEAVRLGEALELSGQALDCFLTQGLVSQRLTPVQNREEILDALFVQYLSRISVIRLEKMQILPGTQRKHVRHIFYADAIDCLDVEDAYRRHYYSEHLYSRNFTAEFQKYRKPGTVISRENMIRLLMLLLMPDLDVSVMNRFLIRFGYAPLQPERYVDGFVDFAVCQMLAFCEKGRSGNSEKDKEEMKRKLRLYDRAVKERYLFVSSGSEGHALKRNLNKLRFMKFSSIDRDFAMAQRKGNAETGLS